MRRCFQRGLGNVCMEESAYLGHIRAKAVGQPVQAFHAQLAELALLLHVEGLVKVLQVGLLEHPLLEVLRREGAGMVGR